MDALTFQQEAMRLERLMYHVSWTMLGNSDDCADAVQEALTRAWQKRRSLHSMDKFRPWLMRILVNQCNDMLRRRKRRSFFALEEAAEEAAAPEAPLEMMDAIAALKPEWRTAIVLHYLEGCSIQEIAAITGAPTGTVKSRLKYARERLGQLLKDEWEEDEA